MSGGDLSVTQTVPNDGTRALFQPPFVVKGLIINNRSNQRCVVTDGRAGQWTARPGATARYAPKYADSNYIVRLDGAATQGDCQVTFTPYEIKEEGEPAVAGPLTVGGVAYDFTGDPIFVVPTLGAIAADIYLLNNAHNVLPNQFDTWALLQGDFIQAVLTADYYRLDLVAGGRLFVANHKQVHFRLGAGSDQPLPAIIYISNSGPGSLYAQVFLRTS